MKTFFDRLPAWIHTMRLAGKAGMTVVATAGNGMKEVQNYLGMMLVSLGVKSVGELGAYATLPGQFRDLKQAAADAMAAAEVAYQYITGERTVTSDEYLESVFSIMRNKVQLGGDLLSADYQYWKSRGMLEAKCFGDVLKRLQGRETA